MRVIVHQGALAEEVVFPEKGQPLLFAERAFLEQLDLPVEDHEEALAGLVLFEEESARRVRFDPRLRDEQGPLGCVQVLEQLDALQELADLFIVHLVLRPVIVSGITGYCQTPFLFPGRLYRNACVGWFKSPDGTASLPVGGLGGRPLTPDPGTSSGSPIARAMGPPPNWGLRGGAPRPILKVGPRSRPLGASPAQRPLSPVPSSIGDTDLFRGPLRFKEGVGGDKN